MMQTGHTVRDRNGTAVCHLAVDEGCYRTNSDLSHAELSASFKTTLEDSISSGRFAREAMGMGENKRSTSSESRSLPNETRRLSAVGIGK